MRPPLCFLQMVGDSWCVGVEDDPAVVEKVLDAAGNPVVDTCTDAGPDGKEQVFHFLLTMEEVTPGVSGWVVVCDGAILVDVGTVFEQARGLGASGNRLSLWAEDGHAWTVCRAWPQRERPRRRR